MPYLRVLPHLLSLLIILAPLKAEDLRIAFGSCNLLPKSTIWHSILEAKPDLMLFLGDNIYLGDYHFGDQEKIFSKYTKDFSEPDLARLLKQIPSYAIWDDHDVGPNNADSSYPGLNASLLAFRKFWKNNPAGPPELSEGVAFSLVKGPVEILMTDNRTYRRHYKRSDKPAFFGDKQLAWIEKRLSDSSAKLIVIASGTQLLSSDGNRESLDAYPEEQKRLLDLVSRYNRPIVFLSGDLHYGEILNREIAGRQVLEITSSPLTAFVRNNTRIYSRKERFRQIVVPENNFGLLEISASSDSLNGRASLIGAYGAVKATSELDFSINGSVGRVTLP